MNELKKGMEVEILVGEGEFFKKGDRAVLTRKDIHGDWWADFGLNKEHCLQQGFAEFKQI